MSVRNRLKTCSLMLAFVMMVQIMGGGYISPTAFAESSFSNLILTTSGGSTAFTSGDNISSTPVVIDSGVTISDPDSSRLVSGTVVITGNFHAGEDALMFINDVVTMSNITSSYNSSTGALTLTSAGATATLAEWQAAMRSVTYTNTAVTPNTSNRTISFTINDGTSNYSSATKTVTVTAVNQTPIVVTSSGSTTYTAGAAMPPVAIDSGVIISDLDNATLASGTVAITGNYHAGEDVLNFTNTNLITYGNITASYNSSTGVLTLTSSGATATLSQWQAAMRAVAYFNASSKPSTVNRTISFTVNDTRNHSRIAAKTVNIISVNEAPILITSSGITRFTSGNNTSSTPIVIDSGVMILDPDSSTLASGTVAITGNFHAVEDVLMFINDGVTMGNITASYNSSTGVLTLTSAGATATLAQWQAAMRSVTYTNSAVTPNTSTRAILFTVNEGTSISNSATKTVTVTAVNQTPIVTTSGDSTIYITDTAAKPIAVDSDVTLTDRDNTTLASGTVAITGNLHALEDVLIFVNDGASMGNITASYNSSTGVLTMTSVGATATLAQWQAAMRAVTYTNASSKPSTSTRTISFTVNDGTNNSNTATKSVAVLRELRSLSANPHTISMEAGQTATTVITAIYSDQSQADVTSLVAWTVQDTEIARVSGNTITGLKPGSTFLTAVYDTKAVDINLTVTPSTDGGGSENGNSNGGGSSGGGSGSSSSSNSSSTTNPTTPNPDPVTPPDQKLSALHVIVNIDRLVAAMKSALTSENASTYKDVEFHWAYNNIALASKLGIIRGYTDGSFRPNSSITRAEFSAILVRAFALNLDNGASKFEDIQNSWAHESINSIASYGLINGYPDKTFRPDRHITRSEMVVLISKIINLQNTGKSNSYMDVSSQHWAGKAIEEATAAGIILGKGHERFAPNDNLTRAEALTVILRVLRKEPIIQDLLSI